MQMKLPWSFSRMIKTDKTYFFKTSKACLAKETFLNSRLQTNIQCNQKAFRPLQVF